MHWCEGQWRLDRLADVIYISEKAGGQKNLLSSVSAARSHACARTPQVHFFELRFDLIYCRSSHDHIAQIPHQSCPLVLWEQREQGYLTPAKITGLEQQRESRETEPSDDKTQRGSA